MEKYIYELKMKVRDYECDLQGIVNNANYQHYLEHTRHEFLTSVGISFARLHEEGVDPVVARLTMAFKTPLRSGDEFVSKLYLKKEGIKYVFYQDIFRLPDMKVTVKATVESVCVVNGRLGDSALFDETFAPLSERMTQDEQICSLALTRIPGLGPTGAFRLVSSLGSATRVFEHRKELSQLVPGVSEKIITALNNSEAFRRAEQELTFCEKNHIRCLTLNDEGYPGRLRECDDAPLALFYRGNADLNALHVINMVGTRHATPYGQDICTRFLADLSVLCPNALIVSGLAYGIDIHAHRAALQNHFKTIGVLAHGLDRIYPAEHRKTAVSMLEQGGLLTEFTSGTNPDRQNFVKRNRIVAGMSDATVVIESAAKGGALITAELAESYHRDCFAFPGRCNDEYSIGCNNLIRKNQAVLITSAEDLVKAMGWESSPKTEKTVQRELFPDLSEEEERIVKRLGKMPEGLQINTLVIDTNIPVNRMSALLFELEMKGVIRALAGGVYRLIM